MAGTARQVTSLQSTGNLTGGSWQTIFLLKENPVRKLSSRTPPVRFHVEGGYFNLSASPQATLPPPSRRSPPPRSSGRFFRPKKIAGSVADNRSNTSTTTKTWTPAETWRPKDKQQPANCMEPRKCIIRKGGFLLGDPFWFHPLSSEKCQKTPAARRSGCSPGWWRAAQAPPQGSQLGVAQNCHQEGQTAGFGSMFLPNRVGFWNSDFFVLVSMFVLTDRASHFGISVNFLNSPQPVGPHFKPSKRPTLRQTLRLAVGRLPRLTPSGRNQAWLLS